MYKKKVLLILGEIVIRIHIKNFNTWFVQINFFLDVLKMYKYNNKNKYNIISIQCIIFKV